MIQSAKILVVDANSKRGVSTSEKLKGLGYAVVLADNENDSIDFFVNEPFGLVIADTTGPQIDATSLVASVRKHSVSFVPVLLVVNRGEIPRAYAGSANEADSYLSAPCDYDELGIRVAVMLRLKQLYEKRDYGAVEKRRTEDELLVVQEELVLRLARAAESRLDDSSLHVERVSQYAALLAQKAGLDPQKVELIRFASLLHDIGKFTVPDAILLRRGSLSPDEMELVKKHAEVGHIYLSGTEHPVLELAANIAWCHHERVDGSGYPRGLAGTDIPIEGRVVAIADVFDSITNKQVYRDAYTVEEAINTMIKGRGSQFDTNLLDLFLDSMDEIESIINLYPNKEGISADIYSQEPSTILVVDDEPDAREILEVKLSAAGYRVLTAADGHEALELRRRHPVDMVLLDVMMPGLDGFDVCRMMKAEIQEGFLPIVLVTAKGSSQSKVAGYQSQADGYVTKPVDLSALEAQVTALLNTKRYHDQMYNDRQQFERLAHTDPLTGLYNRRFFLGRAEYEFSRARRYNHNVSLLMLDVDRFKQVNDERGHLAGDFVLKDVAHLIKMNARRVDTVCRYGGEEFIVLLPNTHEAEATALASRIRRVVEQHHFVYESQGEAQSEEGENAGLDTSDIPVTISIGIASYPNNKAKNETELIHQADGALYKAKQSGRNRVVSCSETEPAQSIER